MRKGILLFGLVFLASFPAAAQDFPRGEIFGGYTYSRTYNSNGDHSSANGGSADVAFYPAKLWGVVADFGGSSSNGFTNSSGVQVNSSSSSFHYLFGPRVRFGNDRITPFADVLFGGVHRSDVTSNGATLVAAQTSFALTAGGGIDFKLANHFSIRAIKINYVYTRFSPPGVQNTQNGVSFSTGAVFHW